MTATVKAAIGIFTLTLSLLFANNLRNDEMSEIKIIVGQNIVEVAKNSGIGYFARRNVAGLISYSVDSLPSDLPVRFIKPGYDASFSKIFAVTLYADQDDKNDLAVNTAVLQFSTDSVQGHDAGQKFVESIIGKFTAKKWTRYIPEFCPAVTGKSNFLQPDGTVELFEVCPLDPTYYIDKLDWQKLVPSGISYEWLGDGVVATLRVSSSDDSRGITYNIWLEYEDQSIRMKHRAKHLSEELREGDEKGWESTRKHLENIKRLNQRVAEAERAAIMRGDQVISLKRDF